MAFDWTSLIKPAVSLGSAAIGNAVAPPPSLMEAQTQKQQAGFNEQVTANKLANQQQVRQNVLPGMYQTLGMPAPDAAVKGAAYGTAGPKPIAMGSTGGGSNTPSVAGTIGKTALGLAPAALSAIPGAGWGLLGLATSPAGIAVGAGLAGAYLWKKSQAHPTANTWVQGEQNPFDQKMAGVDQAVKAGQMTPEQAATTKKQNAQTYLSELNAFSGKGGKEKLVADQAMQTFRQYYGDPSQYA